MSESKQKPLRPQKPSQRQAVEITKAEFSQPTGQSRNRPGSAENVENSRTLSMYDGRDQIGMVIKRGGRCDAFDVHGVHLGTFPKLKAATSAVHSSLPVCVCDTNARRDGSG